MQESRQRHLTRLGLIVFIGGTISNVAEFALAMTVQRGVLVPLMILAAIDAVLITYVFMHVTQLWRPEE